jgi:hypothetical protein
MTKIIDNVLKMKADILVGGPSGTVATENRKRAIAAVTGGVTSTAWRTYMSHFATTPEQLERLLGTDGTGDDAVLIEKRAYLVGNGVCGEGTGQNFGELVDTIDADMPPGTGAAACGPTT